MEEDNDKIPDGFKKCSVCEGTGDSKFGPGACGNCRGAGIVPE